MKNFIKIIFITLVLSLSFFTIVNGAEENLDIGTPKPVGNAGNNDRLNDFFSSGSHIGVSVGGEKSAYNLIIVIARDIKNLFFIISTIFFFIIIAKLIFTQNTEEESEKFKKGLIWISLGIVVMQIAYSFVLTLYNEDVNGSLATVFLENIVNPFIELLSMAASFFFIAIAIYAFYKLVTANGNEDKATAGKNTIIYAIIGFVVITFARRIIEATYGTISTSCSPLSASECISIGELDGVAEIIANIINWMNGFVAIIVVIMIIYAGINILLSGGDEDKLKKAKSSILYITIGILILIVNYLILTFFIFPETSI